MTENGPISHAHASFSPPPLSDRSFIHYYIPVQYSKGRLGDKKRTKYNIKKFKISQTQGFPHPQTIMSPSLWWIKEGLNKFLLSGNFLLFYFIFFLNFASFLLFAHFKLFLTHLKISMTSVCLAVCLSICPSLALVNIQ